MRRYCRPVSLTGRSELSNSQQPKLQPFSAFSIRYFPSVWLGGLIWHLCRWGVAFLGTYLINDMTGSPRLVQLAGTVLYAPLLLGGVLGGVISDRFDRLRTVQVQMLVIGPLSVLIGLLVRAERIEVWMLYLYMFVMGIGWVTDMTSRRALVFDLVGPARLDNAMAMESLSLSGGMVLGALVGGSAVELVGVGSAYFFIAGFTVLALLILLPVKSPPVVSRPSPASARSDFTDGLRMLRTNQGVVSVLGVTVIANFFLFAYFPLVPVVAEGLGAAPFHVGLLLAGTGIGMMIGSLAVARWAPYRRGHVYLLGLAAALVMVVPFATVSTYYLALAAIIASGIGSGFFGATQSTLVVTASPVASRGRALGLLSMAIGALPVGMYFLGEVAERWGASTALVANAVAGAIALSVWVLRRPEVRRMTTDDISPL